MPSANPQRDFALDVVKKLRDAGHEALWAGGCVRDQLLGLPPKDYDVATSALPDTVRDLFGRRRTLAIGAAFGVITVLHRDLEPIEVATFRTDGKYLDGRRPETVAFTTAEHDAQRRDFTINGLFFDPVTERVVDYVGGEADLQARIVRAIGEPRARFSEDRLRMLRAVRFAATYAFELEAETLTAIRSMADAVLEVSGERIGAELRRILTHESRARGVELLVDSELLRALLPELWPHVVANDDRWQSAVRRLHAIQAPTFAAALTAMLYGMADEGQLKAIAKRWRLSNKELERATWLLRRMPTILVAETLSWPELQRLLSHPASTELLSLAAATLPADHPAMIRCRHELLRPPHELDPPPLVTGDDLIAHGVKPGRHFAALLEHLRDEQLEGRLATRNDALAAACRWLASAGELPNR